VDITIVVGIIPGIHYRPLGSRTGPVEHGDAWIRDLHRGAPPLHLPDNLIGEAGAEQRERSRLLVTVAGKVRVLHTHPHPYEIRTGYIRLL